MPAWLLSLLSAVPALIKLVNNLIPSKEERERKRIAKLEKKRRKIEGELGSAIKKAREGDTSELEDIINND